MSRTITMFVAPSASNSAPFRPAGRPSRSRASARRGRGARRQRPRLAHPRLRNGCPAGRERGPVRRRGGCNMIMVRDIELYRCASTTCCRSYGRAHVAYIPNGKIVGLSKVARLVEVFARRLQVQERLTEQIAAALDDVLKPHGRRRGDRGVSPVHDDARCREAELEDDHERDSRIVPVRPAHARGVPDAGARAAQHRADSRAGRSLYSSRP